MSPQRHNALATSDEPDRLANIVAKLFDNQSHNPALSVRLTGETSTEVVAGVDAQDDCAVLRVRGDQELVIGSDYVRGPKFRLYELGVLTEYDLGYYLIAANVSDVCAMGARPVGVVTVVRYPPEMDDSVFTEVMSGIRDACRSFSAPNVGGDIGSAERLILSATAFGVCLPGQTLYRHGAAPGELVCVTGPTGIAGAAMSYFRSGHRSPDIDERFGDRLRASWARPRARVAEGGCLGESGLVTSCLDTSDGLKAAIETIARASGVGAVIEEARTPLAPEVAAVCDHLGLSATTLRFGDSVDFELVFTVAPRNLRALSDVFTSRGLAFFVIGETTRRTDVLMHRVDGSWTPLPGIGWRHSETPAPARR